VSHVAPVSGKPLTFCTHDLGRPDDVTLIPFYRMHRERYSVYWNVLSETEWKKHNAELAVAEARRVADEARVVDMVRPGESQSETDHKVIGEKTDPLEALGRKLRHAYDGGWFSYELKLDRLTANELVCTWWGDESGERNFDILVDGKKIASQKLLHNLPGALWDATYSIPAEIASGKDSVTVKFQAQPGNFAGGLFGLRVLRVK
jgi:hypothetical protein